MGAEDSVGHIIVPELSHWAQFKVSVILEIEYKLKARILKPARLVFKFQLCQIPAVCHWAVFLDLHFLSINWKIGYNTYLIGYVSWLGEYRQHKNCVSVRNLTCSNKTRKLIGSKN